MARFSLIVIALVLLSIAGCKGVPVAIDTPGKQSGERILGEAEGTSVGIMLFNIIPIKQNQRFERAYQAALQQHPGAKRLVGIEIQENWFWAFVLNGYKFTVRGTAVR